MNHSLKLVGLIVVVAVLGLLTAGPVRAADGRTALVIIDVQMFYFPGGALPLVHPEAAAANAARLLERFRQRGDLVIHVRHNARTGTDIYSAVAPRQGEKIISKDDANAFKGTDLLEYLRAEGVTRLVICGMQTHMCVEAATRAAHDYGFQCEVVSDACATRDLTWKDRTVSAADVQASTLASLDRIYATVTDTATFLADHPPAK